MIILSSFGCALGLQNTQAKQAKQSTAQEKWNIAQNFPI